MKKVLEKPTIDPAAVEALLADPNSGVRASADVAAAAVEAALSKIRPDVLWALSGHPVRAVGKSARRALHVLRSRGVGVGERPLPPPIKVSVPEPEPALELCRGTAIDGFGDRALWVPLKIAHGVELWQVVVSDETGVRMVQRVETSRRQLRAQLEALSHEEVALADLAPARVAALLAEAVELGGEPHALVEARELLRRLGPVDPGLAKPVSMGAPPPPPSEESARLAESGKLFDEVALRSFVPDEDSLRALAGKLDEIEVSPLALDERQKAERHRRAIEDAVEAYFTRARRARVARRLFDLVDLWTEAGRSLPAARAAAAARHLVSDAPVLGNPFARMMFERIFARKLAEPSKEATPGGLILPPG